MTNLFKLNEILSEKEMKVYMYAFMALLDNYEISRKMNVSIYEISKCLKKIKKVLGFDDTFNDVLLDAKDEGYDRIVAH